MEKEWKFMVVCPQGLTSSVLMKLSIQKILKRGGVTAVRLADCSYAEGKGASHSYDVIFCPKNVTGMFQHATRYGSQVVGLNNILCTKELEKNLRRLGVLT